MCNDELFTFLQLTKNPTATPRLELQVQDKTFAFLVDTGAEISTLGETDSAAFHPYVSGRWISVTGATGQTALEQMSLPLEVQYGSRKLSHSFLLSRLCPENLLGRDLMCKLGLSLDLTPSGIELTSVFSFLQTNTGYAWTGFECLKRDSIQPSPVKIMGKGDTPQSLRCTMAKYQGSDDEYLNWGADGANVKTLSIAGTLTFQTQAAAVVDLSPHMRKHFLVDNAHPHIPLIRTRGEWEEMGPFVKKCVESLDWKPDTRFPRVFYSLSNDAYFFQCWQTVDVQPTVCFHKPADGSDAEEGELTDLLQ